MLQAVIRKHKGSPAILVEGRVLPLMTLCSRHYTNPIYVRRLYEAGIRVFFIFTHTEWLRPGAWEQLQKDARLILSGGMVTLLFA